MKLVASLLRLGTVLVLSTLLVAAFLASSSDIADGMATEAQPCQNVMSALNSDLV